MPPSKSASGDIAVVGAGPEATILDGEHRTAVLNVTDANVRVAGMTIRNGGAGIGAGLHAGEPETLVVEDVHFVNNAAGVHSNSTGKGP